jgi:hypothetical protein
MEVINRQNDPIVVFGDENVSRYSAKNHEKTGWRSSKA